MYYGVQYYPEHWPESRWRTDAEMMQEAGVNTVRMGEFAWSFHEPREGALNFAPYDAALALFYEHGIKTILFRYMNCSICIQLYTFIQWSGYPLSSCSVLKAL